MEEWLQIILISNALPFIYYKIFTYIHTVNVGEIINCRGASASLFYVMLKKKVCTAINVVRDEEQISVFKSHGKR